MKLYDSLTNKTFDVVSKKITIYNCGPTVYNDIHIGNARPAVIFDVLNRLLKHLGHEVTYIHNITDIDDKIINKAKETNKTELEVSRFYYEQYLNILDKLNIELGIMPKVSENINGIIDYVKSLVDVHAAYTTPTGDVYFDVNSVPNYGTLSHQNVDQLLEGVRIELSKDKKSPLDFVLWKKTETGLNWKSPWSIGRPGWHTECAYFIKKYVGDHVTIHGGGIDLKFPHHENENAQNNALFKRNIADLWMHVGHITMNSQKMAKSVGNVVFVKDLLEKYTGNDIRWFLYQSHYRSPLDYSNELFEQSTNELLKLFQQINNGYVQMVLNDAHINEIKDKTIDSEFIEKLSNDLDISNAKAVLWNQAKKISSLVRSKKYDEFLSIANLLTNELKLLGIKYKNPIKDEAIKSIVEEWKKSLQTKNYIQADKYREQLTKLNILG